MDVFSAEVCEDLVEYLRKEPFPRWFHRKAINSIPTTPGGSASDYYFMGDRHMKVEDMEYIKSISPLIDGEAPFEIGFNMYKPGNYMPEHIDRAMFRYTMVIQLSCGEDGISIDGEFFQDQPGKAVVFEANSLPHAVPPVKELRFVMLCLYK